MNTIPNVLPTNLQKYFINLKNYLETELYFYGSVVRGDYIKNKSDIDLCIFTDNEPSTIMKLKSYFKIGQQNIKKVVQKSEHNGIVIYGYKIKLKIDDIKCEIQVYNNNFKNNLLKDMQAPLKSPFYANIFLYILKFFYYTIPLLSKDMYSNIKNHYINNFIKKDNTFYLVL